MEDQAANFVWETGSVIPPRPGEWLQLAIVLNATQTMLGDCAFHLLAEDDRQAEIGFTLAGPYQGQGYASEAVTRLLEYLFDDQKLHRVQANCDPRNLPSTRLLERVGMRHEGRLIKSLWFKGEWVDEDWYAILREEWRANRLAAGIPFPEDAPSGTF